MSAGYNRTLFNSAIAASATIEASGVDFQSFASDLILVSTVSSRTDGTYTVTLQESPDNITWFDVDSCAAQSANGTVIKKITVNTFSFMRAKIVSDAVTDGAVVHVRLYYNHQGK